MGPSASAGKKVSAPTMTTHGHEQGREQRPAVRGRQGAEPGGYDLLAHQEPASGQDRDDEEEAAGQHREAEGECCTTGCWR